MVLSCSLQSDEKRWTTNNKQVQENLREWRCGVRDTEAEQRDGAGAT